MTRALNKETCSTLRISRIACSTALSRGQLSPFLLIGRPPAVARKGGALRASSTAPGPSVDALRTGQAGPWSRSGAFIKILLPSLLPPLRSGQPRYAGAPRLTGSPPRPGLRAVAPVVGLARGLPGGGPALLSFLRTSRPRGARSPAQIASGAHRPAGGPACRSSTNPPRGGKENVAEGTITKRS